MQAKVYCVTTKRNTQSFYVSIGGKEYFLFSQGYRTSNKEYFENGVTLEDMGNYNHSLAVRKTLDKLPTYLRYVEKEYGIEIYQKDKKNKRNNNNKIYKKGMKEWEEEISLNDIE